MVKAQLRLLEVVRALLTGLNSDAVAALQHAHADSTRAYPDAR